MGDAYKSIVDQMGALYAEMQKMMEEMASADGAELEAMEKQVEEKKSKYDALAKRRDMMADLNSRAAKSAHNIVVSEPAVARAESRGGCPVQGEQYETRFADYLKNGFRRDYDTRALAVGSGDGQYLPSTAFFAELQKSIEQETSIYNLCRKINVGTFTTNFTLEGDFTSAQALEGWAGEAQAVTEYDPTFSNLTFTGNSLRRLTKISRELVQDAPSRGSDFAIESMVAQRMGRLFGMSIEYQLWHGDGSGKPQGLKNASVGGTALTSTATSLATDGTLTQDELITWIYSLPMKYMKSPSCAIVASQSFYAAVRKLGEKVTGSGGHFSSPYLWEPSYQAGTPDRLLGIPVHVTPWAPDFAATANQVHAVVGDFSHMVVAQRTGVSIQVLNELYAATGQVAYLGETRLDAKIVRLDAFRMLRN